MLVKRTGLLLAVLMAFSVWPAWAEAELTKDIMILYTSDVHCAIDQGWGYGGIYAVKQSLAEDNHVLLVDDGDAIQGEPIGLMTKGEAIVDIMNATGYDIAIPGNHEFDYGLENFLELVGKAEYPYISCNFNKMGELLDERMSATIASTEAALVINEPGGKLRDGKPVRLIQNTQTNLGDLCADAYLDHFEDADVAIVNGSGIRSDIPSGAITMNDIMRTLPYGTKLDLVKVTGQQLLDILEWSVHAMPEEFGGFEHVAGLTYEVDLAVPTPCVEDKQKMFVAVNEGMPRRVGNVRVGGVPIDAQAEYRLVTNDYILVDGDGFTMFRQADVLEESDAADSEALLEYITVTLNSLVGEAYADPYGQGRMVTVGDQAG